MTLVGVFVIFILQLDLDCAHAFAPEGLAEFDKPIELTAA
jgi:hypothetical protein